MSERWLMRFIRSKYFLFAWLVVNSVLQLMGAVFLCMQIRIISQAKLNFQWNPIMDFIVSVLCFIAAAGAVAIHFHPLSHLKFGGVCKTGRLQG